MSTPSPGCGLKVEGKKGMKSGSIFGLRVNHLRFPVFHYHPVPTRPAEDLQTQRGPTSRMQTWSCFATTSGLAMKPTTAAHIQHELFFLQRTPLGLALWKTMETATLQSLGRWKKTLVRLRCFKRIAVGGFTKNARVTLTVK